MSHLDIFSDVVCPWCFIGKRRLEAAVSELSPEQRPTIRWHAYQLDPTFPEGRSVPSVEHLAKKFGGVARMKQLTAHVAGVAKDVGITIDFDKQRAVNTRLAHRAVAIVRAAHPAPATANGGGAEDLVVEQLFQAHFTDGRDLSDVEFIAGVLDAAGVDDARGRLDRGEGADDVDADLAAADEIGITGVPFFVLDDRLAVSGAQEPATFLKFLREGQKA